MSRRLAQLTEIIWLIAAIGCTTAGNNLSPPPGSASGSSDGGSGAAGQSGSTNGGTAGNAATGGAHVGTGGAPSISTGGTVTSLGGGAATGGATSTTLSGAISLALALGNNGTDATQGTVTASLPTGAAGILVPSITLTFCGSAGGGPVLSATDMHIDYAAVQCPQVQVDNCPLGQRPTITTQTDVTVTGRDQNVCYVFGFSSVTESLVVGGNLSVQFRIDSNAATTLNRTYDEVWTALINGQSAGTCTIAAAPSTTVTCS